MSNKKRIEWVDVARFIGIMFVILSHFEVCPQSFRILFEPFFLAIFFFCSGYLYKDGDSFVIFFKKKLKQLFIPWLIYSNLNIIISNIKSIKHHQNSFLTEVFRNMLQIRYFDERLWFVPALFTAFIAFYFVIKWYEKKHNLKSLISLIIALAFIRKVYKTFVDPNIFPWGYTTLPWHIDYIPTALFFMVLGYLFKKLWEEEFDKLNTISNSLLLFIFYVILVYVIEYLHIPYHFASDFIIDHFRHLIAILMIVSISKRIKTNKYISYIGSNTLIYFFIHNKVVTLFEYLFEHLFKNVYLTILNNNILAVIYCLLSTIIISFALLIPTYIINKYLPFTIGKDKK